MRSLRGVGVLFSLLIVGVLGGLIAPFLSEAHPPTVTLQVDTGGAVIDILNYGNQGTDETGEPATTVFPTCTATEIALGYNFCYSLEVGDTLYSKTGINTNTADCNSTNRCFKVQNYDGSTFARLLIADQSALNGDRITLSGVKFVPYVDGSTWPATERHVLNVTMGNTFNLVPGTNGTYVSYLRTAGVFDQLADANAVGDQIYYYGRGTFDPNDTVNTVNPKPIANSSNVEEAAASETGHDNCRTNPAKEKFCVGSLGAPLDYPALVQSATLPNFPCNNRLSGTFTQTFTSPATTYSYTNASNKCTPIISTTMRFTFFGPDGVRLSTSNNVGSKKCKKDNDCTQAENSLLGLAVQQGEAEPVFNTAQPCSDTVCNGTLRISIKATPAKDSKGLSFPFTGSGPFGVAGDFLIPAQNDGNGSYPDFENLFTRDPGTGGNGPGYIIDAAIEGNSAGPWPPKNTTRSWQLDSIVCTSTLGTTIKDVDYTVGSGSTKGPLTVNALGNGDTLSCDFHIHNSQ